MTSSMPTSAATAAAVAALSPVSSSGTEPERPERGDRLRARRLRGVRDDEQAAHGTVPPGRDHRLAPRLRGRARRLELGREVAGSTPPGGSGARPRPHGRPRRPRRRAPRGCGTTRPRRARRSRSSAAAAMARATGCSEACSSAPTRRSNSARSVVSATTTSRTCMRPVVTVPVLSSTIVSTRRVDSSTSGPLMRMPSWAPLPVPTSSAVGVASPRAHGQAMISTATAVVIAKAALAPPPSQKPSVATARAITIGHEDRRDAIGEALHGRLAGLGVRHEPADLRQRGVGAHARGAHDETPAGVDGRAGDLVAGALLDRDGLAREERLVDGRGSLLDDAVGRDLLARADDEAVADAELADRDAPLAPVVVEHGDVLRAEREQRRERGAGAALGAGLEVAPGQDQRRSRRRRPRGRSCRSRPRAR